MTTSAYVQDRTLLLACSNMHGSGLCTPFLQGRKAGVKSSSLKLHSRRSPAWILIKREIDFGQAGLTRQEIWREANRQERRELADYACQQEDRPPPVYSSPSRPRGKACIDLNVLSPFHRTTLPKKQPAHQRGLRFGISWSRI